MAIECSFLQLSLANIILFSDIGKRKPARPPLQRRIMAKIIIIMATIVSIMAIILKEYMVNMSL